MNFWQQIQNAAEIKTLSWLVLVFIAASVILFVVKPSERLRLRTALLLFAVSLVGLLVAATLLSYGVAQTSTAYRWVSWSWRIFFTFAVVNVAGVFVFEVLLESLHLKPPRIMSDLLLALSYVLSTITILTRYTV